MREFGDHVLFGAATVLDSSDVRAHNVYAGPHGHCNHKLGIVSDPDLRTEQLTASKRLLTMAGEGRDSVSLKEYLTLRLKKKASVCRPAFV